MDPYLDDNTKCPIKSDELEYVDLITVSHATFDHLGDTIAIAKRTGARKHQICRILIHKHIFYVFISVMESKYS